MRKIDYRIGVGFGILAFRGGIVGKDMPRPVMGGKEDVVVQSLGTWFQSRLSGNDSPCRDFIVIAQQQLVVVCG